MMAQIRRLPDNVVQKIAAGEIIQKPVNAVKEMIENSLDAGATFIQVIIKDGGFSLIQIQDNGKGVNYDDLPLLCERFCTSKISSVEDLINTSTFGFRGEALSSISYISKVTVLSRAEGSSCAYKAVYSMGKLVEQPKSSAGNIGTIISVENMFDNMPLRKKALIGTGNEEYSRILDLISKYSLQHSNTSFSCRKAGSPQADFHTAAVDRTINTIKMLFPSDLVRNLCSFSGEYSKFSFKGFISKPSYSSKKSWFALFVNNRLVANHQVKKLIDSIFQKFAMKNNSSWVFLSLKIEPKLVDVNVHPSKMDVRFLEDDLILESISKELSRILSEQANAKELEVPYLECKRQKIEIEGQTARPAFVRVNSNSQTLEQCLAKIKAPKSKSKEDILLTSIHELRNELDINSEYADFFSKAISVGSVNNSMHLFQHGSKLLMVDLLEVSEEYYVQHILNTFQRFEVTQLEKPTDIKSFLYLEQEFQGLRNLIQNRLMLVDYFGLSITEDGCLTSIPNCFENFVPAFEKLNALCSNLSDTSLWEEEKTCFKKVTRELARFFRFHSIHDISNMVEFLSRLRRFKVTKKIEIGSDIVQLTDLNSLYKIFERC